MRHFSLLASFDESSPSCTLCLNISSFIACAHRKLFSVCSISAVLFISSLNNATRGCKRCVFHMQITSDNFLQLHLVACIIIFIKMGLAGEHYRKKKSVLVRFIFNQTILFISKVQKLSTSLPLLTLCKITSNIHGF